MRRPKREILAAIFLGMLLSGCSFQLGGSATAKSFYTLGRIDPASVAHFERRPQRLLIRDPLASGFINSQKILFSRDPLERGQYQFASWVDTPPKLFGDLLERALDLSGLFLTIARQSSVTKADLQLNTDIEEFYHDTSDEPGVARIEIAAELVDFRERVIIASKRFTKAVPVKDYDARGAAEAFSKGIREILAEMTEWLAAQIPSQVTESLEQRAE